MHSRFQKLENIRPKIAQAKVSENMNAEERFQNETLRPILKFQNELILLVFKNYILKRKNVFYQLTFEEKIAYISHAFQKDLKLRNSIKGIITGLFTIEEYHSYRAMSSALNKRMMQLIIKRLQDQLQYFDEGVLAQ